MNDHEHLTESAAPHAGPEPAAAPIAAPKPQRRSGYGGIAFVLAAIFLFVSMDTLVKFLAETYSVVQISFVRFASHQVLALLVLGLVPRFRPRFLPYRWRLQLARSAVLAATTFAFFTSLSLLPLAETVSIAAAAPLLVVAFSVVFLGEKVGVRRWTAAAIGFLGVLVILRPGFGFAWAMLLPLACAFLHTAYQLMTRHAAASDHAMTTFFFTPTVGFLLTAALAPLDWQPMPAIDLVVMALPGLLGGIGHLCMIVAFTRSEASFLAPFFYTNVALAALFGWAVFGHIPDAFTATGASIIVAAGLYVSHRERVRMKERAARSG